MFWIQYDPYSQTAEVRNLRSDGTTTGVCDIKATHADELRRLEKDIILQNRMEALIRVLKNISDSKKVDIRFVGTDKDFRDFEDGIKRLKEQEKLDSESKLEKAKSPFFHDPDYIRDQLHRIAADVLADVGQLRKDDPENTESLHFDDAGFMDTLNGRTPLVFIGKGSMGKSAVINALIGAEVLQTGNGTTTEAVYEIIPDENNFHLVVSANGYRDELNFNCSKEEAARQLSSVFHEETNLMTDNPYDWVYQAVFLVNKLEGVSEVSIRVPFQNLKSISDQVVIYDTPGPDSMTRTGHKDILNNALGKFKKGVVIFVTTPTEIEKVTLRSFLNTFTEKAEQLKSVLNVNAGIIVINQSDTSTISSINDGKESRKKHLAEAYDSDTKQGFQDEEDRIIYFSSPYPIGIHKAPSDIWMDSTLEERFVTNSSKVSDLVYDPNPSKKKFYLPLATVAELPPLRKTQIVRAYEEAERRFEENQSEENRIELIAHNSGLRALEYELGFVVNELSICNLCSQAQNELENVLERVKNGAYAISREIEKTQGKHQKDFDNKYRSLLNKLFGQSDSVLSRAKENVKENVSRSIVEGDSSYLKAAEDVRNRVWEGWSKEWHSPESLISERINENESIKEIIKRRNEKAEEYCKDAFKKFRNDCQNTINRSSSLSEKEREAFMECLKKWEYVPPNKDSYSITKDEVRTKFLGIIPIPSRPKTLEAAEKATMSFLGDHLQRVYNSIYESFEKSCDNARNSFYTEDKLKEMDPELRQLSRKIYVLKLWSIVYQRFQKLVEENLKMTRSLTERQEKGTVPDEKH